MMHNLEGLRIVVSGFELEQQEHRGIAAFSKGLLRALKTAGAEIWLLTEYGESINESSRTEIPKAVQRRITAANILEKLNSGENREIDSGVWIKLLERVPIARKFIKLLRFIDRQKDELRSLYFPKKVIRRRQLELFYKKDLTKSPYERCERLSYLREVDGIICAKSCFRDSFSLGSRKKRRVLQIDLEGFDMLITTSPLNIEPLNIKLFTQTIHDLIPLDYQRTRDDLSCFTRRLEAAKSSKRIFVSEDARQNYEDSFEGGVSIIDNNKCVVTQSPSLSFPGDALEWEARAEYVEVSSSDKSEQYKLKPFTYFLFNSSVVPHKNLLFALKAFIESGLGQENIRMCITGKPQNDEYSQSVGDYAALHSSIIFTGYVDEATKRKLYLNALGLLSPSLIEGFGIPVLDAGCLGLQTIASPLGSHREIQKMHDFEDVVLLCSTLNTSDWASAMRLVAGENELTMAGKRELSQMNMMRKIRSERILRYRKYQDLIDKAFRAEICKLLSTNYI